MLVSPMEVILNFNLSRLTYLGRGGKRVQWWPEVQTVGGVRHASRNADSAYPILQYKKGTLSQQFVMHVAPPLIIEC